MSLTSFSQPQAQGSGWERKKRLELAVAMVQETGDGVYGEIQGQAAPPAPRPETEGIRSPKERPTSSMAPLVKTFSISSDTMGEPWATRSGPLTTPPGRLILNKKGRERDNKCRRGYGESGTLVHCWWARKMVWTPWRTHTERPRKRALPFPGIHSEGLEQGHAEFCTPMFTAARSRKVQATQGPTGR